MSSCPASSTTTQEQFEAISWKIIGKRAHLTCLCRTEKPVRPDERIRWNTGSVFQTRFVFSSGSRCCDFKLPHYFVICKSMWLMESASWKTAPDRILIIQRFCCWTHRWNLQEINVGFPRKLNLT